MRDELASMQAGYMGMSPQGFGLVNEATAGLISNVGENIDIRMSNYITILSNPNAFPPTMFDKDTLIGMKRAVAVYLATTSKKYLEDFTKQQRQADTLEQTMRAFK